MKMKTWVITIAIIVLIVCFFIIINKQFDRQDGIRAVQQDSLVSVNTKQDYVSSSENKVLNTLEKRKQIGHISAAVSTNVGLATGKESQSEKPHSTGTQNAVLSEIGSERMDSSLRTKEASTEKPLQNRITVAESQVRKDSAPVAVPVITAEEADDLNEFATFLSAANPTVVEGEIIERSELPDPGKSDYPNCRFTVHFNGNAIKSGEPCPKELSLILEGFENYQVLPNNSLKAGDKVTCSIIPFEQLPEKFQSTQQADDLELYLLESYYVVEMKKIGLFSDNGWMPASGIYFTTGSEDYISIFDRHINSPIPDDVQHAQIEAIKQDLDKMNSLLEGYDDEKIRETNARFAEAWNKEKEKDPPNYNRVGNCVWRNRNNSFWCLPDNYNALIPEVNMLSQETLDSFAALNNVCKANGVQLLVVPVPNNYIVSSRVIMDVFKDVPDIQLATCVKQLLEIDVEAIYTTASVIENYNRFCFAYNYPLDYHPADTTQDVISDLIAERLSRLESRLHDKLNPSLFSIQTETPFFFRENQDYRFPKDCDIGDYHEGDFYMCRKFLFNNEDITNDTSAPVLMVGNSFIESPIYPPSAPSILSSKILSPINWRAFHSHGPFIELLSQIFKNPSQILSGKQILIYYFGIDHLLGVNSNSSMLDLKKLDDECILLNNRKCFCSFPIPSNISNSHEKGLISDKIGSLGTEYAIKVCNDDEWVCTLTINEDTIDYSKPMICIIPSSSGITKNVKITVGNQTKQMSSSTYASSTRLYPLSFELPAGTRSISIKVDAKNGTLFAIKDVQIWQ